MELNRLGTKVFIIAELSSNHNNDFDLALQTINAMKRAGADAVKIQTYTADSLTLDVDNKYFEPRKEGLWKGLRPYDVFSEGAMPYEWQPKLKKIANDLGLVFFSSPFDKAGVDFLESIDVPAYKIASFEITDIPLIRYVAEKRKPVIISTGVATLEDIELAVKTCRSVGNDQIALLKCTSEYPAAVDAANLITIPDLLNRFDVTVGVSDHTMGNIVPTVAVALGAKIVEKHFILNRELGGPDSAFSMEPGEFEDMVKSVREAEAALGNVSYEVNEKNLLRRRSLFVVEDIEQGDLLTEQNVRSIRPGYGMHPKDFNTVLNARAKKRIERGTPLDLNLIEINPA